MTKREFLKKFAALGIGSPFISTLLSSCDQPIDFFENLEPNFNGNVLIVGAGAAGITAGYLLYQQGIDFKILEASEIHGGRVKKEANFADFPIDLGGEWIHTDPSILAKLNNDQHSTLNIEVITYNPQTISVWRDGRLRRRNIARNFYSEYKFKNSTWFDFFDSLMVPNFAEKIIYNSPVSSIEYSGEQVVVSTTNKEIYTADKALITAPITILQSDIINFVPALPDEKIIAINNERMPGGLKVFIEFSERFYPDLIMLGNLFESASSGDHTYYDAAFGKDSNRNIFALFTVGDKAERYLEQGDDSAIIAYVLEELDTIFEGKASQFYIQHLIQNWSAEPFIRGSYSHGWSSPEMLAAPVNDRLYFAGEAMVTNGNTSTVHGAAESAFEAVKHMITS